MDLDVILFWLVRGEAAVSGGGRLSDGEWPWSIPPTSCSLGPPHLCSNALVSSSYHQLALAKLYIVVILPCTTQRLQSRRVHFLNKLININIWLEQNNELVAPPLHRH